MSKPVVFHGFYCIQESPLAFFRLKQNSVLGIMLVCVRLWLLFPKFAGKLIKPGYLCTFLCFFKMCKWLVRAENFAVWLAVVEKLVSHWTFVFTSVIRLLMFLNWIKLAVRPEGGCSLVELPAYFYFCVSFARCMCEEAKLNTCAL